MRSMLLIVSIVIGLVCCQSESVLALGGGNRSKVKVQNVNSTTAPNNRAIRVWLVPTTGTALPKTKSEASKIQPQRLVSAGKTETFSNVKPGDYVLIVADEAAYRSLSSNAAIPEGSVATDFLTIGSSKSTIALRMQNQYSGAPFWTPEIFP